MRGLSGVREPQLRELDARDFLNRRDDLLGIYAAAMRPPPEQLPGRRAIMERHATYPRFRALVAERGRRPVAFCYGFLGTPGQWWHDVVRRALTAVRGGERCRQWLADAFEIAEVHVLPNHQGRGIGRQMVTALCSGRPERTVVLSTLDRETPARHLYRSLGLSDLLTDFRFPGGGPAYAVMGSALPLTSAPTSSRE
jgi:ribosomal protein S18 acetylase RimI-like enzyme